MRILVINYEFPPVGGGGGRMAENLCRVLARRGYSVRVLTSWVSPLPRVETRSGYDVFRTFAFRRRADRCSIPEMAGYCLTSLWPAYRHMMTWKPNIVHVHFAVPSGAVAMPTTCMARVPYVLTAHLGDVPGGVPDQTDRAFRWIKPVTIPIWKRAAAVTAVSEFTRQLACRAYDVEIETIPNGVDLGGVTPTPVEPFRPLRFIFVGRLNAQKNLSFLFSVLGRMTDLPWQLELVGDGPERAQLEAQGRRLGFEARLRFRGWLSEEGVAESMRQSDALLLPSLSEGLSMVGLNSLAHGLAIVASAVEGNLDLVQNGENGILCRPGDAADFETSLRRLLSEPECVRRMKQASRERAGRFDLEHITDRYEQVFERVAR